jgi:hydrogenase-4 component B
VSALLSGVLLKVGVYGLVRIGALLPHPPLWWGGTLLAAGAVSGIIGIAFAASQRDFKRLLAYSSIENVGIMVMGLGLALVGRALSRSDLVFLGLGGALLHVLNHSLFKPLLFMGAGSLLHAVHTRQIDLLGGLGKRMPRTFVLFAIGAVAICGLPPLNGFVSELLIYLGLFRALIRGDGRAWVWASLAAPALAIIGALAIGAFVKLLGTVFAGGPRTRRGRHAHDPGALMLAPMALLALLCTAIGVLPVALAGLLERAVRVWNPQTSPDASWPAGLVPWRWMTAVSISLVAAAALAAVALRQWRRHRQATSASTWDCGYAEPSTRMQYTGSSFTEMLAGLFRWVLVPRNMWTNLRGIFAERGSFSSEVPDVVLDRGLFPGFRFVVRVLACARPIQSGPVQVYLVYVLAILLALLFFAR